MDNKDSLVLKMTEGFFQNALENNKIVEFQENLRFLSWSLERNPSYKDLLNSPFIDLNDKYNSLDETFKDVLIPEVLLFAKLLIDKKIFKYLDDVKELFSKLVYEEKNYLEGIIYSAFPLNDNQISKIQNAFQQKFKCRCIMNVIIHKNLIAGIKVLINETIYEYSADSKLADIQENLNEYYENYFNNNKEAK